ncbi:hypothetical protein HXX76_012267 [Chlamydomonas incerta]|uniref:Methyltransferase domain-containing protein n=1 Tax=Chlamydomonas incerta TaxID=51695 RepID=A0A835SII0_CHLIN|nr:hypothetical protein HXX76_012267 [Chlamydomonas incerta]|eukprot:KAG2427614.1 hypothetical protein HXX76_012267 [Chlamydomonas incerta]
MWRSNIFKETEKYIVSVGDNPMPDGHKKFAHLQPFITCPPNRPLRRVGPPGDGGKWICDPAALESPCTILSLGSNNDFSFEAAVLKDTSCKLVTLDCTVSGATLSARHTFLPVCIGSEEAAAVDNRTVTYSQLISMLDTENVPLLKIDVETYEYPTFASWNEYTRFLPEQIAVEVHWHHGITNSAGLQPQWGRSLFGVMDLSLFFMHLANLGYGIVNKEDNPACPSCSEFTLFRVEANARVAI